MKTLRAMALAATLAAVCVLPVLAGPNGDPGPCVPGTPCCPLDPPQSVQVNPHPLNADGASVEVPTSGELVPVEAVAPMPAPRFVDPLALGSEGGSSLGRPSGSGYGPSSGIVGSDSDLLIGAGVAGSSGVGGAAAGAGGGAAGLALAGWGGVGMGGGACAGAEGASAWPFTRRRSGRASDAGWRQSSCRVARREQRAEGSGGAHAAAGELDPRRGFWDIGPGWGGEGALLDRTPAADAEPDRDA